MKRISLSTIRWVRWGPFVAVPLILVVTWWLGEAPDLFVAIGISVFLLGATIYIQWKSGMWDLADEVLDEGDHLVVKFRGMEDRIPLSSVTSIEASSDIPTRIELHLSVPCKFGQKIAFLGAPAPKGLKPSPVAAELRDRLAQRLGRVV